MAQTFFKYSLGIALLFGGTGSALYWGSKTLKNYFAASSPIAQEMEKVDLAYDRIGEASLISNSESEAEISGKNRFTIEIVVAKYQHEAESAVEGLNREGLPAFFSPEQLPSGAVIYRVRMGLFGSEKEAHEGLSVLAERTTYEGKLVAL